MGVGQEAPAGTLPDRPAVGSSVFFILTAEDCSRAAVSYLAELEFARERFGRSIPLAVAETDRGPSVWANARALAELAHRYPEQRIHHLTLHAQRGYFERLCQGEPAAIREIFRSARRDRGTAMNKLYLMTVSFGAEALHRRDSDTRLLGREVPEAVGRYPIEVELAYLGRRVGDVDLPRGREADAAVGEAPICVVGGDQVGAGHRDVRDRTGRPDGLADRLCDILGLDLGDLTGPYAGGSGTERGYDGRDTRTLLLAPPAAARPDCANMAITGIHELLPSVPSAESLAVDRFSLDAAMALGIPALWHSRAVFHDHSRAVFHDHGGVVCHEHGRERVDSKREQLHWEAVARFADYRHSYRPLFEPGSIGRAGVHPADLLPAAVRTALSAAVGALAGSDRATRAARIRALAREVLIPLDARYARVGAHLMQNAERYVWELDGDYARHKLLLERWPYLVDRARWLDLPALVPALRP